jgi:NADPH2:quinone reductase
LCKRSQVHPLPERVSYAQGAGVFVPYVTAYRALFQLAHARPGETLLVHVPVAASGEPQCNSRAAGIIGTAGSDEGLQLVKKESADHVINHRSADYQKQILDLTNGSGVNVILEALANVTLSQDLKMLAYGGRVVVVGSRGNVEITPRDIMVREAAVFGIQLWKVLTRL